MERSMGLTMGAPMTHHGRDMVHTMAMTSMYHGASESGAMDAPW